MWYGGPTTTEIPGKKKNTGLSSLRIISLFVHGPYLFAGTWSNGVFRRSVSEMTEVGTPSIEFPEQFILEQNFPNPFNPITTIRYALPKVQHVSLKMYNLLGQEIMTVVDARQEAGYYTVEVDVSHFSSGIYFFYVLRTQEFRAVKRIMVLK